MNDNDFTLYDVPIGPEPAPLSIPVSATERRYMKMAQDLKAVEGLSHDEDAVVSIWLASLEAYNDGYLVGRWISLPTDEDALQAAIDVVSSNGQHDWAIHDFESSIKGFKVDEYQNVQDLNELAETLDDMSDEQQEAFMWLWQDCGYDMEGALEHYEEVTIFESWTWAVADWIEMRFGDLPEQVRERFVPYLDEDYIKTEMEITETTHEASGGRVFILNR